VTFRDRVGTNKKHEDIGFVDSAFNLLVKAFTGWEVVAIEKNCVTAVSERKGIDSAVALSSDAYDRKISIANDYLFVSTLPCPGSDGGA